MPKKKPKTYRAKGRGWLNGDDYGAVMYRWYGSWSEDSEYVSCSFSISDCYRVITLDLESMNHKEREKRLRKLNLLISEMTKARDFVAAAKPLTTKEANKLRAARKKAREAKKAKSK